MRVDFGPTNLEPPERNNTSRTAQTGVAANQAENSSATVTSADRAHFSFDQARVHSLVSQAMSAPEIRQAKISALAQAIASGRYSVDAAKVADAITAEFNGTQLG